ncbi:MAG: methyltransferase [Bdellovibrionales bacterium]|nr:methyltransferase [Bdellovibrionales bacterium]
MLYVVATPIGCPEDLSLRALDLLRRADLVIGEERKVVTQLLKHWEATGRPIELLNEHSDEADLDHLVSLCKTNETVVLISDCGTPGFCDPGADLVNRCRKEKIPVTSVPGASSLMALLSQSGFRLDQFFFRGFLPAKTDLRKEALEELQNFRWPVVLMDTPYRLERTLSELAQGGFSDRKIVLGLKLTQEEEKVLEGTASGLLKDIEGEKAEFILILFPSVDSKPSHQKKIKSERNKASNRKPRKKYPKRH